MFQNYTIMVTVFSIFYLWHTNRTTAQHKVELGYRNIIKTFC